MKEMSGKINDTDLTRALRRMAPETGSLRCLGCGYEHRCGLNGCAIIRQAVERLKELTTQPSNDPLTMEQLREMGKDWVWIDLLVPLYGMNSGYYIKHPQFSDVDKFCCGYPGVVIRSIPYSGYRDTWIACRCKPEEG